MTKILLKNSKLGTYRNIFANGAVMNLSPPGTEVFLTFYTEGYDFENTEEEIVIEDKSNNIEVNSDEKDLPPEDDTIIIQREFEANIVMNFEDFNNFVEELVSIKDSLKEQFDQEKKQE